MSVTEIETFRPFGINRCFQEQTQQGGLDVTAWMEWFVDCLGRAVPEELAATLRKASLGDGGR